MPKAVFLRFLDSPCGTCISVDCLQKRFYVYSLLRCGDVTPAIELKKGLDRFPLQA